MLSRLRRSAIMAAATAAAVAVCAAPTAGAEPTGFYGLPTGSAEGVLPSISAGNPLTEVDNIDLEKYVGTWYQVAAIPQPYNLQCASNTTATYAIESPETISVVNSCKDWLGNPSQVTGHAKVQNKDTNASLRVWFDGIPFQNPDGPTNYRVTYYDGSIAIVGSPERASGFVLSRTPALSAEQWSLVSRTISQRGWQPWMFLTAPTDGGVDSIKPVSWLG